MLIFESVNHNGINVLTNFVINKVFKTLFTKGTLLDSIILLISTHISKLSFYVGEICASISDFQNVMFFYPFLSAVDILCLTFMSNILCFKFMFQVNVFQ